jgi:hypothetical protein
VISGTQYLGSAAKKENVQRILRSGVRTGHSSPTEWILDGREWPSQNPLAMRCFTEGFLRRRIEIFTWREAHGEERNRPVPPTRQPLNPSRGHRDIDRSAAEVVASDSPPEGTYPTFEALVWILAGAALVGLVILLGWWR